MRWCRKSCIYYNRYENMEGFQKEQASTNLCFFTTLILIIQALGLTAVILVAVWMGHFLGGFAWQEDPAKEFNFHPVFMIIGMVFLCADSILAYRVFRNMKKTYVKLLHAGIHVGALVFAAVGLKAVFDSHNLPATPIPNLYSLHSWLGLLTVILFALQWVFGLVSFLFPKLSYSLRVRYMPHHVFWGLTIFGLACASALTGITEKVTFLNKSIGYANLPPQGILINCLGLTIVIFAASVFYVITRPEYKRPSSPEEEEHMQLATN